MSALLVAAGLLVATAGCSPDIRSGGHDIADPQAPLEAALTRLKQDNEAGIQNNSITVSDETHCFYRKPSADADDIAPEVVCGPIRRLGQPDDKVWDRYALSYGAPTDDKVTATVGKLTATATAVDTSLLVSPDKTEPADAADLDKPQAPQTSVTDRAIALPADALPGLRFAAPAQPITLTTPTATFQVTGVAASSTVPQQLVAGTDDPAGTAAYYRPALGQKVYAVTVKTDDPAERDVPASTAAAGAKPQPLSSTLGIGIANGRTIPIIDQTDPATDTKKGGSSFTVACRDGGDDAFPCRPETGEFTILMSVPTSGGVTLAASTGEGKQRVDLQAGTLTSTVSQVEYGRKKLTADVDEKLKVPSYTAKVSATEPLPSEDQSADPTAEPTADPTADPTDGPSAQPSSRPSAQPTSQPTSQPTTRTVTRKRTAAWSMQVGTVALTAYDPTRGWAPSGKAWLVVQTSKYHKDDPSGAFTDRRASSLTVTAGGTSYRPDGLTDADFGSGRLAGAADVTWVFQVPDDLDEVTLQFRPTGTVTAGDAHGDFTVDKPAEVQLKLPK